MDVVGYGVRSPVDTLWVYHMCIIRKPHKTQRLSFYGAIDLNS